MIVRFLHINFTVTSATIIPINIFYKFKKKTCGIARFLHINSTVTSATIRVTSKTPIFDIFMMVAYATSIVTFVHVN